VITTQLLAAAILVYMEGLLTTNINILSSTAHVVRVAEWLSQRT